MNRVQLALDFTRALRAQLTPEEMQLVIERGRAQTDAHICHTHDFCDANMLMLEAAQRQDPAYSVDRDPTDWNAAWDLAVKHEFSEPALVELLME